MFGTLGDAVTLLEPATKVDRYTGTGVPDWSQPPVLHPGKGVVQVVSSTEAVLTSGTVVQKARCWLPPGKPVTSSWRVRWDGDDYEIDGAVERKKRGTQVHHMHMWLKRVD